MFKLLNAHHLYRTDTTCKLNVSCIVVPMKEPPVRPALNSAQCKHRQRGQVLNTTGTFFFRANVGNKVPAIITWSLERSLNGRGRAREWGGWAAQSISLIDIKKNNCCSPSRKTHWRINTQPGRPREQAHTQADESMHNLAERTDRVGVGDETVEIKRLNLALD